MQEKHLHPWKRNISKYNQVFLSWLEEIGHHVSYDEYEFINALSKPSTYRHEKEPSDQSSFLAIETDGYYGHEDKNEDTKKTSNSTPKSLH